ncbi:WD repeat-containing protein 43 [Chytriomyces hyalinus]|nr:WD repeat-containing protein 43 [Chytriomyces hyalinus]
MASSKNTAKFVDSGFSSDGRYFYGVSETKSVTVWDTASHAVVYSSKKGTKVVGAGVVVSNSDARIALVLNGGTLSLVSLATGLQLNEARVPPSTSCVKASQCSRFVAVCAASTLSLFHAADLSLAASVGVPFNASVSSIAFNAKTSRIAVASTKMAIFDLDVASLSLSLVKTFTGHASPVNSLSFSHNDAHLVSSANQDRFISVWDAKPDSPSSNVVAMTLDTPPTSTTASAKNHLLAVTDAGAIALWSHMTQSSSSPESLLSPPKKKKHAAAAAAAVLTRTAECSIAVRVVSIDKSTSKIDTSVASKQAPILAAHFLSSDASSIQFAFGSALRPCFERVSALASDHEGANTEEKDALVAGEIEIQRAENGGVFVGIEDLVAKNSMTTTKKYNEVGTAKVIASTNAFSMNLKTIPDSTSGSAATQNEASIQDRLNSLNLSTADSPLTLQKKSKSAATGAKKQFTPTATSLHTLLTQAIQSGDKVLLEQCLHVKDSAVITGTVKSLHASHVAPLLDLLTERLAMRPTRVDRLIEWIRALVLCHAAYLMTNPHLVSNLSTLHSTLSTRTQTFSKLLKLSGRLDLATSQISLRASRAQQVVQQEENDNDVDGDDSGAKDAGVAVYDEADEDDMDGDAMEEVDEDDEEGDFEDDDSEVEFDEAFDEDADLDGLEAESSDEEVEEDEF